MLGFLLSLTVAPKVSATVKVLFASTPGPGYSKSSVPGGESDSKCGRLTAVGMGAERRAISKGVKAWSE